MNKTTNGVPDFNPEDDSELGIEYLNKIPLELVPQQEKATIDIQVSTAKAHPRKIRRAVENAIYVVTLSKEIAEDMFYAIKRGGKTIEGPTIHFAKVLAQNWGNLRMENRMVAVDHKHVTCQGICWDLESNLAVKTEVKRSIIKSDGTRFSDDMITVTGNAGNSIALRNAILAIIPAPVSYKVQEAAEQYLVGKLDDAVVLKNKVKETLDGFKDVYEVTQEEILKLISRTAVDNITKDDVKLLIKIKSALRNGDTTVDEQFRGKQKGFTEPQNKKDERIILLIKDAKTIEKLKEYEVNVKSNEARTAYDAKYAELMKK
jgi:hypothetical protein